ncbi:MAG: phage minor capsid protein [Bacilli bacterium]
MNALIKVVNDDLKTANTSALRMANDQYRQVIHKSAFFVGNGVFTEQQAAKMGTDELSELKLTELAIDEANKNFLAGGLNCIEYSNGRRVNLASYSQMAVRTANLRAQLMGEGDFRKSIGRTLVQATSHGGACPICQKWEKHIFIDDVYSGGTKEDGKYMLLSDAMKQGFLHPNCRHGITTYYPELEGIENETEEEYQANLDYINERLNYIIRNEKKYSRLEQGSISPINIQMFANKKNNWVLEKKKIITKDELYALNTYIGSDSI